jgi:hypothetical protein
MVHEELDPDISPQLVRVRDLGFTTCYLGRSDTQIQVDVETGRIGLARERAPELQKTEDERWSTEHQTSGGAPDERWSVEHQTSGGRWSAAAAVRWRLGPWSDRRRSGGPVRRQFARGDWRGEEERRAGKPPRE